MHIKYSYAHIHKYGKPSLPLTQTHIHSAFHTWLHFERFSVDFMLHECVCVRDSTTVQLCNCVSRRLHSALRTYYTIHTYRHTFIYMCSKWSCSAFVSLPLVYFVPLRYQMSPSNLLIVFYQILLGRLHVVFFFVVV